MTDHTHWKSYLYQKNMSDAVVHEQILETQSMSRESNTVTKLLSLHVFTFCTTGNQSDGFSNYKCNTGRRVDRRVNSKFALRLCQCILCCTKNQHAAENHILICVLYRAQRVKTSKFILELMSLCVISTMSFR